METTVSLSRELNLTRGAVGKRAINLGIKKTRRHYIFTEDEADAIRDYKEPPRFKEKYHKRKIHIVDFFLQNPNNTISDIANKMDLPFHKINNTIDEWCNNEHFIIVESKINEK